MMRTFVCAALALVFTAGLVVAQEKKKQNAAVGTVKKIDAATSTITVSVKRKDAVEDKEYKIGEEVKFVVFAAAGEKPKELASKDGFKAEQLKEGARIRLMLNDKGEVTQVALGEFGKKKKDK